jgi:hypothetical protein
MPVVPYFLGNSAGSTRRGWLTEPVMEEAAFKRFLKKWNVSKELSLNRSVRKLAIPMLDPCPRTSISFAITNLLWCETKGLAAVVTLISPDMESDGYMKCFHLCVF